MIAQEQEIGKPYILACERKRESEGERETQGNLQKFRKKSAAIRSLQKRSTGE